MKIIDNGLSYRLTYTENEWLLTLINTKVGSDYLIKRDFFFYGEDDDEYVSDVDVKANVFSLSRKVLAVINKKMSTQKPQYFFFKASTERKKAIYKRMALRLEKMFNGLYKLDINDSYFYFFRNI
ncbi:MAG: hypothetical protein CL489_08910 [Acidobacteria bacterium]|nr:hypothetical protein [Acidobacteriota bacterium]|tara:strand:- start:42656 stop:43030 length:375 start_codon:yes stop_codon:yes gene_type:complete